MAQIESNYRQYLFEVTNANGAKSAHSVTACSMTDAEWDMNSLLAEGETITDFIGIEKAAD